VRRSGRSRFAPGARLGYVIARDKARESAGVIEKQKLKAISGFPEWLPELRMVELEWLDKIRALFESYGYAPVETRAVEPVEVLLKQGDTDKEIYAIKRLAAEPGEAPEHALHYDMTVPMARYVAANMNELAFPFKRYQMQKAWRGERPQDGRFREFYQCDVDVVDVREIPLHFDAEMPAIMFEALDRIGVGPTATKINNRKILQGYYEGLGISDPANTMRIVDKLDKIGRSGVGAMLASELALDQSTVAKVLALSEINGGDTGVLAAVEKLGVKSQTLEQGLHELGFVLDALKRFPSGAFVADLSIARGLAYYTGSVYETKLVEFPDFPTVCGGGRYDNLVGSLINRRLPGIGISIGLTRIFWKMQKEGRIAAPRKSPTDVLVLFPRGGVYAEVAATARALRSRGLKVEMYHEDRKIDAQFKYATDKGIPYVWFLPAEAGAAHKVKDLAVGTQHDADPASWLPA
jgi:histidyl-tRNA synthetase